MEQFREIFKKTSWLGRAFGSYKMPPNFPCVEVKSQFGFARIPIVMFAQGQLQVEERTLRFQSVDWPSAAGQRFNLRTDWEFELRRDDIRAVEKFEQPPTVLKYYSMNFTRVQTKELDLLLCVGGSGPLMNNIKQRSEELQQELLKFKA